MTSTINQFLQHVFPADIELADDLSADLTSINIEVKMTCPDIFSINVNEKTGHYRLCMSYEAVLDIVQHLTNIYRERTPPITEQESKDWAAMGQFLDKIKEDAATKLKLIRSEGDSFDDSLEYWNDFDWETGRPLTWQ